MPRLSRASLNSFAHCLTGSWTAALIDEMSVPSHRPMFVTQAYLSPFNSHAMDSTNLIAMASGIGGLFSSTVVLRLKSFLNAASSVRNHTDLVSYQELRPN